MSGVKANCEPETFELRGGHVLAIVLTFFAVILAVNGYFLYVALSTHSGVVAVEPYRKGLAYNDRIDADQRQTTAGWQGALILTSEGGVALDLQSRAGFPIDGQRVSVSVGRPSTVAFDRVLELREVAPGRYVATSERFESGNWIGNVEVRTAVETEPVFRMRRRIWLKP